MSLPLTFDYDRPIPTTSKGMDALVLERLARLKGSVICESVPYQKFAVGDRLYGMLTAAHEYISMVKDTTMAEKILMAKQMGRRALSQMEVDSMSTMYLLNQASFVAADEYRRACYRLGFRLWKSFINIDKIPTGDKLEGLYGVLDHRIGMTYIRIAEIDSRQAVAGYSGNKRIFRRRVQNTGQLTWLMDDNKMVFSSNGLDIDAVTTVY